MIVKRITSDIVVFHSVYCVCVECLAYLQIAERSTEGGRGYNTGLPYMVGDIQ